MLVLLDNGTPRGLARFLTGHSVEEARARGWEELSNGELIEVAEQAGFLLMVTTDKNIQYQQNLKARKIAIIVLEHSQWPAQVPVPFDTHSPNNTGAFACRQFCESAALSHFLSG